MNVFQSSLFIDDEGTRSNMFLSSAARIRPAMERKGTAIFQSTGRLMED